MSDDVVTIKKRDLLKLRLESLFIKQALQRGLFPEVARELAERAAASPEFALDSEGNLNADDWTAGVFVDGLADDPRNEYLFQQAKAAVQATPDEQRKAEASRVAAMSPLAKLEYANQQSALKRARG